MAPRRQPLSLEQCAELQLVEMVVEAADGLLSTPGDPRHPAVLQLLHRAVREGPSAAADRLCEAVLAAVDRSLVLDGVERVAGELLLGTQSRLEELAARTGIILGLRCGMSSSSMILSDLADVIALAAPVDEEVVRTLLVVAATCISPSLTCIDTTGLSAATTAAVVSQLHKLQGLTTLRLTRACGAELAPAAVYPLARALHGMPVLRVLVLAQSGSDNVLRVLAQACPDSLEELDVSHSRAVTDKGVTAVLACANLRVLKLTATSATAAGAERALRGLAGLHSLGRVRGLGSALAAAVRGESEAGAGRREELQLRAFKSYRPPPLRLLAEHCPRLQAITIVFPEDGDYSRAPSAAALRDVLPELRRLSVTCEILGSNDLVAELMDWPDDGEDADSPAALCAPDVKSVLDNLVELKLRGTVLGLREVWALGQACPLLHRLVLSGCPERCRDRQLCSDTEPLAKTTFQRLRCFIAEDLPPAAEIFVLSNGVILEEVSLWHFDPGIVRTSFGDEALQEVLRENPMNHLKVFCVEDAPFLGARSAERLLACPRLRTLGHLDSWGRLDADQLEALQLRVDAENLDVYLAGGLR